VNSLVEFKNVICDSVDKEFCRFEYCYLKSVNRTYKYVSGRVNLFQLPITNVTVNIGFYKRMNGYKPFLYNETVDGCKFIKNQKGSPITKYYFDFFKNFSNINHSCPYNHDLIIEKVTTTVVNHRVTKVLPFPEGDYMLQMNWSANGVLRAITKFFFSLT
ncbi:hypothetical protein KR026_008201, partial [Drosophila bipectinata]